LSRGAALLREGKMDTHTRRALAAAQSALEPRVPRPRSNSFGTVALVLGITLALFLTWSTVAHGEEAQSEGPRRATVEVNGVTGIWFRADVAREMLADLSELPLVRTRVQLLEGRLEIRDDQITSLRSVIELSQAAEERAVNALDEAVQARRAAEDARDAWYRSPVLWTSVGMIIAGALVALTAYALSAVPGS
jgi:hypothetical protein